MAACNSEGDEFDGMEVIVSSRQHYKKCRGCVSFGFVKDVTNFHLQAVGRNGPNRPSLSKASTFDNGDGKLKLKNPLSYNYLADSIEVIS